MASSPEEMVKVPSVTVIVPLLWKLSSELSTVKVPPLMVKTDADLKAFALDFSVSEEAVLEADDEPLPELEVPEDAALSFGVSAVAWEVMSALEFELESVELPSLPLLLLLPFGALLSPKDGLCPPFPPKPPPKSLFVLAAALALPPFVVTSKVPSFTIRLVSA